MLKKYNIFLFIILILLICFCLFNRSLMENMDNSDVEKSVCNKPSTMTFSGKSKNKNNSEHPHSNLQITLKKSKLYNNCTNYNALPELEASHQKNK